MRNTPHRVTVWERIRGGFGDDGNPSFVYDARTFPAYVAPPSRAAEGVELVAWIPARWDIGTPDTMSVDNGVNRTGHRRVIASTVTPAGTRIELAGIVGRRPEAR